MHSAPVNEAARPRASTSPTCRVSRCSSPSRSRSRDSAGSIPAARRSRPRGPSETSARAWVATAPMPPRAQETSDPTARNFDCTATPTSSASGSAATIEKVTRLTVWAKRFGVKRGRLGKRPLAGWRIGGPSMATIHEVARRAGVSITTVSHVYSGKRPVAPETKERVLRAADALEYRPNRTARGLATGRAMTFGLHVPPEGDDQGSFQELLRSRRLDGVIVADPESSDPVIPGLVDAQVPVVTIGRYLPDPGLPWVDNDHARALRDLFAH